MPSNRHRVILHMKRQPVNLATRRVKRGTRVRRKQSRPDRQIVALFRKLSVPIADPRIAYYGRFYDPTVQTTTPGIEYRTILTNGTGRMLGSGYAQLE